MADGTAPTNPDIAVVIATLGRAEALQVCLESLARQTILPAVVMVVHSGADAATRAVCDQDWRARGLAVQYVSYPLKSAALQRDFAIRRTSHPLILLSDDDTEFEPAWIDALLTVLTSDARVGATMGCIVGDRIDPTALWRCYRRLVASPERANLPGAVIGALVPNGFPADLLTPVPTEWIGGGITLMRREAYLSVDGFAPHFRGSSPGEDVDLGYRLSRKWRVQYVPAARCLHHQSPSGRERIGRHQYLSMRSRYAFCRVSVGMGVWQSFGQIMLWALFQTASEMAQLRRGQLRPSFLQACWGRLSGAWSCVGWNPSAERLPAEHHAAP